MKNLLLEKTIGKTGKKNYEYRVNPEDEKSDKGQNMRRQEKLILLDDKDMKSSNVSGVREGFRKVDTKKN